MFVGCMPDVTELMEHDGHAVKTAELPLIECNTTLSPMAILLNFIAVWFNRTICFFFDAGNCFMVSAVTKESKIQNEHFDLDN